MGPRFDLLLMLPFAVILVLAIPVLLDEVIGWFQNK